jgi:5-methylcytosine-specific restriction endonuclease McrA
MLLADLRKVATSNQGAITVKIYEKDGEFNIKTIMNRFGKWNDALKAARIEPVRLQKITDEALFENIEEIWLKLGRQPKNYEVRSPLSKFHADTYINRFGTWNNALKKFVEFVNSDEPETIEDYEENIPEEIIKPIQATKSKKEKPLTAIPVNGSHNTRRDINWRMRFQVLARDNFRCVSCGLSPAIALGTILHVDHILPWSKGGETVMENLQTLCATCNLGKGNVEQSRSDAVPIAQSEAKRTSGSGSN